MTKREVIERLGAHKAELANFGVKSLSLFGSVARDEATATSDVDLLVEFDREVGLFAFFRLQHYLEGILGVDRVDLLMPTAVKSALRGNILTEALRVA